MSPFVEGGCGDPPRAKGCPCPQHPPAPGGGGTRWGTGPPDILGGQGCSEVHVVAQGEVAARLLAAALADAP